MTHLVGGPYYELSLLLLNSETPLELLNTIIEVDNRIKKKIEIEEPIAEFERKKYQYSKGWDSGDGSNTVIRTFDIDVLVEVSGIRKARLFLAELSSDYAVLNFWFLGTKASTFNREDDGIHDEEKQEFRKLFHRLVERFSLSVALGTIGYEVDSEELFSFDSSYPSDYYQKNNLKLDKIRDVLLRKSNDFEYCWLSFSHFEESNGVILNQMV